MVAGPPKSAAGRRIVQVPPKVMAAVREHLVEYVADAPASLVFTGRPAAHREHTGGHERGQHPGPDGAHG